MRLFLSFCFILLCIDVHAVPLESGSPTDDEMKSLPPYCHAKQRTNRSSAEFQSWKKKLGSTDFNNIHHLCNAKAFLIRASRRDVNRGFYLNEAYGNLRYHEKHHTPDFILLPEVYYLMAKVSSKRGENSNAVKYAYKSIAENKKYLKPYLLLSDIYFKQKVYDSSEEILNKAKQYFPKSRGVKRRIKKLENIEK